jgi:glycosyltransferase involved in cell wall biosynthesis
VSATEEARPELSAIVLCYSAGRNVLDVFTPLKEDLEQSGVDFEIVLVGNYHPGTDDPTPQVVAELSAAHERVRYIAREKEGAMGWDMKSGLAESRGEVLVVIDGDGQNPPETVVAAYRLLRESGADVLKGRRVSRADGLYRGTVSLGYNLLFRLLFGTRGLWDINGKPKGLTRGAYAMLELASDDWFIDAEIVLAARRNGLRIVELPVRFRENEYRSSFVRPGAIWEFVHNIARQRLRRGN